jgi:hypothetical protein
MVATLTQCEDCGEQDSNQTKYCPNCGAGPDPWEEVAEYDFERDVELPLIFDSEVYNDDYGLWRDFCSAAFDVYELRGDDIANFPNLPKMKYQTFLVYYKLHKKAGRYKLEGPFLNKEDARNA